MVFTYIEYKEIIDNLVDNGYKFIKYNEADTYKKEVILRHDVDVSPDKAIEFAKFEKSIGCKSTYYFLITSNLYNAFSRKNINIIKEIKEMGHDIGLHFDETNYEINEKLTKDERITLIKSLVLKEKHLLEQALEDINISSVSMHIPSKLTLEADINFEKGMINSYGMKFFNGYKYISDSEMRWRENVYDIINSNEYSKLHILTHPIWWDESEFTKKDKIIRYCRYKKCNDFEEVKVIVPNIEESMSLEEI